MPFLAAQQQRTPLSWTEVNGDDSPVDLEFGRGYIVNNDGAEADDPITLDLPVQASDGSDLGKVIWVKTRYANDPTNDTLFGHGTLKGSGGDVFRKLESTSSDHELLINDDNYILDPDGQGDWLLG